MLNYSFKAVKCNVVMYFKTDSVYKSSVNDLRGFQVSSYLYDKGEPQLLAVCKSYKDRHDYTGPPV